ncbi:hypothetical protein [Nocardioides soli]|uniref:HTH cro/C1-type domain-containing protein n=1 Tax=Nocardioides soli TaxID=1036020 RepID=A0A7W4VSH5_9ACTN|nr:hypothetical protein [Nocardioides soli]MBB3040971.1 hypothetical protein [Nocardioides soli]
MNPMEYGREVNDALPRVIEEARWDARISSVRELARLAGFKSHTLLNQRMRGAVAFTVPDLVAVGRVVGVPAIELLRRAKDVADGSPDPGKAGPLGRPEDEAVDTPFKINERRRPASDDSQARFADDETGQRR